LVFVRLPPVLHLNGADLGLAVGDGSGGGNDKRALLMAGREAVVGAEHRRHDMVATGSAGRARQTARRPEATKAGCWTANAGLKAAGSALGAGETFEGQRRLGFCLGLGE